MFLPNVFRVCTTTARNNACRRVQGCHSWRMEALSQRGVHEDGQGRMESLVPPVVGETEAEGRGDYTAIPFTSVVDIRS